jgi:hypothetical protein
MSGMQSMSRMERARSNHAAWPMIFLVLIPGCALLGWYGRAWPASWLVTKDDCSHLPAEAYRFRVEISRTGVEILHPVEPDSDPFVDFIHGRKRKWLVVLPATASQADVQRAWNSPNVYDVVICDPK